MPRTSSVWPSAETGFTHLWSVYICQTWCRLAAGWGWGKERVLLPKQYNPEFKFVNRRFRLAVRGEVFSEGDDMGVSLSLSWESWYSLGRGGIQGEVNKPGSSVWLSWENCNVSMLVENADVSLVLEGYLWDSIFQPSYSSHWVSRRRGEPCMLGQGAVLECGRGSPPAFLPASSCWHEACPQLCPQRSWVPP